MAFNGIFESSFDVSCKIVLETSISISELALSLVAKKDFTSSIKLCIHFRVFNYDNANPVLFASVSLVSTPKFPTVLCYLIAVATRLCENIENRRRGVRRILEG